MGREIERKFLLANDGWRRDAAGCPVVGVFLRQGYLGNTESCVVRVRVAGAKGFLTVKGPTRGASRSEFEYEIPPGDAHAMLDELVKDKSALVEKTRYRVEYAGLVWEIDEFAGLNKGLVLAEVELEAENQPIDRPDWLGREVTSDPRYFNSNLARVPFSAWKDKCD